MKKYLLIFALVSIPLFGYFFWHTSTPTLTTNLSQYQKAGEQVRASLSSLPALPIQEEDERYTIEDTTKEGIQITYANQGDNTALAATPDQEKPSLTLRFPKQYATEPIEVQIAEGKSILIQDKQAKGDYTAQSLSLGGSTSQSEINENKSSKNPISWLQSLLGSPASKLGEEGREYLSYTDATKRITTYYAYGHDQATGEKQLKNWQVYNTPGIMKGEQVAYSFTNAKLRKNEDGTISVYYYGDQELQNDKASAQVDPSLMARAQRTLAKEMGDSIDAGTATPNFIIPKPYYINSTGDQVTLDWRLSMDGKDISIDFIPEASEYPLALDPTLSFTAPAMSNTGDVITGESGGGIGSTMTAGDFNADGKTDLAVGASGYSSSTGRVYLFYQDGTIPVTAASADVIITGEATSNYFGTSLTSGDFNADGKTDFAVGAHGYSSNVGRAYIFYNDGKYPTTAATADVAITGEAGVWFGVSMVAGDFNADGKADVAIGGTRYASYTGRPYIFYADGTNDFGTATCTGSNPTVCLAGNADLIVPSPFGAGCYFGSALSAGDFNSDGKTDLTIGAYGVNTNQGRAFIFYNTGSAISTTPGVTISGTSSNDYFGSTLTSGDFNADGRTDLAVGAYGCSVGANTGCAYIFYNDVGGIPTTAATADVIITGETTSNYFGGFLSSGDFNADGRTDLVASAYGYSTNTGRAYIFYNDGSIPTTAATADVIITGEGTGNAFGAAFGAGDFNADGRTDLAVSASWYASNTGRAYIFYSQNGQVNTNQTITGNASGDYFGYAMTTGDFNADGRTDLAVGAPNYSTNTGRAYIFYGDGQIPTTAATADVTITGEATSNYFGCALTAGDVNADGKTDIIVGAYGYSTSTGRAYIFYNDGSIPTTAATADVIITGETTNNGFGESLMAGDFNADGRTDFAVGASFYSTSTGRVYIFYNDGSIPTTAATADVIITGQSTSTRFGISSISGDFNADGKIDLAVGAAEYSGYTGRAYIFYADGTNNFGTATCSGSPSACSASNADAIITGEAATNFLGYAMTSGDFNVDGRIDLAIGSYGYGGSGCVYIFYNGAITTENANGADVIITAEAAGNYFGFALTAGDMNADGKTDLAVGAHRYSSDTGRAYIFYADGTNNFGTATCFGTPATCSASNADVIITGAAISNYFGISLVTSDFNADGRTDLVVGAYDYSTGTGHVYFYETRENFAWKLQSLSPDTGGLRTGLSGTGQEMKITGNAANEYFGRAMTTGDFNSDGKTDLAVGAVGTRRVYIFYNDGSLSASSSGADVVISGAASDNFGYALAAGDFNSDGRTDLAVTAVYHYRAFIFYNDGSYPVTSGTADVTIVGSDYFGWSLVAGDFNADGRTDLAVGDTSQSSFAGSVFIFYNDGSIPTTEATADVTITSPTVDYLGYSLTAGDFNADGRTDLVVGAYHYATSTGRAFIFYNDGTIPTSSDTADVIITGEGASYLGISVTSGDMNADGKTDLIVGGPEYNSAQGRAYIFYADGTNNFGTATCAGSPSACSASNADVIITGGATLNNFGVALVTGDFNGDGRTDLVVGANEYAGSNNTGRAYVFYNDGSIPTTAATADVTLTGEATSNHFGLALAAGDLNADGRTDLVVGAYGYSGSRGRTYIYTFNDPVITGETTNNSFGASLVSGDFNADGKIDLAVGASGYSTNTGRVYLFYQDGTIPATAASADVIITGEATSNYFGSAMTAGDLNADGKTDLIAGAYGYSTNTGRAYIFYNDGSIPTTAATADVIITGEATNNNFGHSMTAGDLNADSKTDLVVGAYGYNGFSNGRAYIFYNGAITTENASGADVIITGEVGSNYFGDSLVSGDFNSDGRIDLAVGAYVYNSSQGRVYIFYNDGVSFGTVVCTTGCLAADADVIITGEATLNRFGYSLISGDFNADGRTDLAVDAYGYSSFTGRVYIFYNDGVSFGTTACTTGCLASNADIILTDGAINNYFGWSLAAGDFNADGRTDLAVGAFGVSTNTGRTYIFYNDGVSFGTVTCTGGCLASNADVILTGETTSNWFGYSLTSGDWNADGKTDLTVGAYGYSTSTGRVYLFTSEAKVDSAPSATARVRGVGKLRGTATLR